MSRQEIPFRDESPLSQLMNALANLKRLAYETGADTRVAEDALWRQIAKNVNSRVSQEGEGASKTKGGPGILIPDIWGKKTCLYHPN